MRIDIPDPGAFRAMLEREIKQTVEPVPTGISVDSREVTPGDLFVALKGENTDGHLFLEDARKRGSVAALVNHPGPEVDLLQITVEEPSATIASLSTQWRSNFSLPVLGLTGSNGKTTTKDLLVHIFSATEDVHGTRGNYNTRIGLSLTLLELTSHHTLSILEMGANQRGDIGYLSSLSFPQHGMITNIAPTHLTGFGSIENVAKAKGELFEALPADGIAFVNGDDERVTLLSTKAGKVTYGFGPGHDFSARLHRGESGLLSLTVNDHTVDLNSYNHTFARNALAACAVSVTLGVDWEIFKEMISRFTPTKGRCRVETLRGVTVIDDTYNANLTSALAALDLLFSIPVEGRRIVVFADMLELGRESESHHRVVGEWCVEKRVDLLLCYGEESRTTWEAAKPGIDSRHYAEKEKLAVVLRDEVKQGDVVLFKGSRAMALETVMEEVFTD
ncbi:MAG: UDP-N-acetylmuramoyl-tripeptide--D-alanyl-D-alanine ligase [Fidelibacterota bacterium]